MIWETDNYIVDVVFEVDFYSIGRSKGIAFTVAISGAPLIAINT